LISALRPLANQVRDAAAWRVRRLLGDGRIDRAWVSVAKRWRSSLKRTVFIGITGSAGKTTTKELLLGILSASKKGVANRGSLNVLPEVAKTVMRVRPSHDFCVVELSEDQPDVMAGTLALLQPTIGIITLVKDDHLAAFTSRDALAAEMTKLVALLPANGTAILNADDERVLAMAAHCTAKVITFGLSPTADLRAEDISSAWPNRLQMTLVRGTERVRLTTQLCGTHWIPSVLGAVGGGLAAGMTLEDCAASIATISPFEGRMQPVTTPDGVTFIRDDFKAPLWTLDACFDFMKSAQATRKIIVIGGLSDVGSNKAAKYTNAAHMSQDIADITVFVGPWASSALKARRADRGDALKVFAHVRDAAEFIKSTSRAGDLILLKGTNKQDHLLRFVLAREDGITCWRDDCLRPIFCDVCPDRMKPSGVLLMHQQLAPAAKPGTGLVTLMPDEQVIVGLGNPELNYANTPHNIGYAAVDHLAESIGLEWIAMPQALLARGVVQGQSVCLIKVNANMNLIGDALKKLSEGMSFNPAQCILVYDDLDLPLGTVRTRVSGSAGRHRGVASILEAFQTDSFRRVKVGVGQALIKLDIAVYVLTPFDTRSGETVNTAIAAAAARLLEMAQARSVANGGAKVP
jgi:UDP-N-acetylmuramoyl-tripeptide--D-alanyl-D-alanine ligase